MKFKVFFPSNEREELALNHDRVIKTTFMYFLDKLKIDCSQVQVITCTPSPHRGALPSNEYI